MSPTPVSTPPAETQPAAAANNKVGVFFEGFHELRAVAALSVLAHHIELMKQREGLPTLLNTSLHSLFQHLGKNGVYLFFVLSGFLITYLLLAERERFGFIDIRSFYIRRVLRIWPLYYLIVALAFLVLPYFPTWMPFLRQLHLYRNPFHLR